jgi:alpha-amylase
VASENGDVVNLFMDYDTFGEHQKASTGIFDFMKALPQALLATGQVEFATVSEATKKLQPVAVLHSPYAMSWADEERDVTAWLGNDLQNEAFQKLYALAPKVKKVKNKDFEYVWHFMQNSDHFYYMATKWFSDGDVHSYFNPYGSAYEAFINYMNVLSDFLQRVDEQYPTTIENEELNELLKTIQNQEKEIETLEKQLKEVKKKTCAKKTTKNA